MYAQQVEVTDPAVPCLCLKLHVISMSVPLILVFNLYSIASLWNLPPGDYMFLHVASYR